MLILSLVGGFSVSVPLRATAIVGQNTFFRVDLNTGAAMSIGPNPSYTAFDFLPGTSMLYGAVPVGDGFNYRIALLSPETGTFTPTGPSFDLGGQVPSEMTFDDSGNVFVIDPLGRIKKIDFTNSTVTSIRGLTNDCFAFGSQFSCVGLAFQNGHLMQAGISSNPVSTTMRYYTIDPITGGVLSFQDGALPAGTAPPIGAWLDSLGGMLYMGIEDNSGRLGFKDSVAWGIADPATGIFTKLSDNQLPASEFARGLAIEETNTPEPSTGATAAGGIGLLIAYRIRRRKANK